MTQATMISVRAVDRLGQEIRPGRCVEYAGKPFRVLELVKPADLPDNSPVYWGTMSVWNVAEDGPDEFDLDEYREDCFRCEKVTLLDCRDCPMCLTCTVNGEVQT